MDDIDKYSRLELVEFYEFIARAGVLLFKDQIEWLLTQKIEKVLEEILALV